MCPCYQLFIDMERFCTGVSSGDVLSVLSVDQTFSLDTHNTCHEEHCAIVNEPRPQTWALSTEHAQEDIGFDPQYRHIWLCYQPLVRRRGWVLDRD